MRILFNYIEKFQDRFFPEYIKYVFNTYFVGILVFTCYRFLLFLTETDRLSELPADEKIWLIIKSFVMGFRFDTVISGYILSFPFLFLGVLSILKIKNNIINRFFLYYILIFYIIAFFGASVDIPFFNQHFSRLTVSVLLWTDNPNFMITMIFQEIKFWWPFVPLGVFSYLFYRFLKKNTNKYLISNVSKLSNNKNTILINILIFIFFSLLLTLGIRGRITGKSPIRIGTAYFSNYAFVNKLGLNPVYTFLKSCLELNDKRFQVINLIDNKTAVENVKKYFKIQDNKSYNSPIARKITANNPPLNANVVIILMESMGTVKMGRYGNLENLTPNLDKLAENSLVFDNIYTAGIHTFNGVYSTLFSFPTLYLRHPMKGTQMPKYNGIASVLRENGYSTIYFTTHDNQFDNIGGFLKANDFEEIVSLENYPLEKQKSTLGVPDDYMFEYSIEKINKLHEKSKPFLAVFLTASDHGPYIIPEYFKPNSKDIKKQIVEYADWSISKFIKEASNKKWFENTIFVFIADHGAPISAVYDMPLTYHHTPLIFYSSKHISKPKVIKKIGGQIDVFPTILGLLNISYINNTFGIDLLNEERPYIFFTSDDKYGVIDNEYYYIYRDKNNSSLYRHKHKDTNNYIETNKINADKMKLYAESMFQASQFLIYNQLTQMK
ncbi:MAG: sulfatase-like hydrolase/transferase [Spirochaetia bacterium]|nr:sulfatase-like hydrolase/transferase [Spirochaetia bacterium]